MSNEEPPIGERLTTWLVEAGLYQPFVLSYSDVIGLAGELSVVRGFRLDCYCPGCRSSSVYSYILEAGARSELERAIQLRKAGHERALLDLIQARLSDMHLVCARAEAHILRFVIKAEWTKDQDNVVLRLTKIGQSPSKLDLLRGDLVQYAKVADEADLRELQSAAMCHSHGLHVAGFAYLRRVFERRLEIAHGRARQDTAWNEDGYDPRGMRMDERIEALASHLPRFLVENRAVYKILSKGIHELTEDECQAAYPALHDAISLILAEEIEQRDRTGRLKGAQVSIQRLSEKYSGQ